MWTDIIQIWKEKMAVNRMSFSSLFTEMLLYDPGNPTDRNPDFVWITADSLLEKQIKAQRHLNKFPGTYGIFSYGYNLKGETETLKCLWENRNNIDDIIMTFTAALLFEKLGSSRCYGRPDNWPSFAYDFYYELKRKYPNCDPWEHYHTSTIPGAHLRTSQTMNSLTEFIEYLAEKTIKALRHYKPVVVKYVSKPNPFIKRLLDKEQQEEEKQHKEWIVEREKQEKERKERQKNFANLLGKPLKIESLNNWPITNKELERLVWSMPTSKIAEIIGLSDTAIKKRCRKWGIPKPPRGFWAKVNAGKIPHPQGVPQSTD